MNLFPFFIVKYIHFENNRKISPPKLLILDRLYSRAISERFQFFQRDFLEEGLSVFNQSQEGNKNSVIPLGGLDRVQNKN